jgi:hypothetical protein
MRGLVPDSGYMGSGTQPPLPDPLELQLREALEREAETAEILRVIASSPANQRSRDGQANPSSTSDNQGEIG